MFTLSKLTTTWSRDKILYFQLSTQVISNQMNHTQTSKKSLLIDSFRKLPFQEFKISQSEFLLFKIWKFEGLYSNAYR